MRRGYAVLFLGWGVLAGSPRAVAARAAPPPLELQSERCDDLDPESLVRALAAELPALLATDAAAPIKAAGVARPAAPAASGAATPGASGVGAPGASGAGTLAVSGVMDPEASVSGAPAPLAARLPAQPRVRFGRVSMRLAEYARSTLQPLLALARRGRAALCAALPREFELHRLAGTERGHFSAYFHPILRGSRTRHGPYQFPLYRRPADPASQLTTAQILAGGLDDKGLELVYLDSLSTALNVHIEGSATVQLDEGGEVNLTTDGNNGQPYTNPFKLARQDGVIRPEPPPEPPPGRPGQAAGGASSPPSPTPPGRSKTRVFFDAHPDLLRSYWAKNPHFVFFKPTPLRGTGKFGQLIAGRSVAVDADKVPLGAALWMRTELASVSPDATPDATPDAADSTGASRIAPGGEKSRLRHIQIARLALAQDTGAAIRGVGRVDVFVGSGAAAEQAAAFTSRPGELYLIVRKVARKAAPKAARKAARKAAPKGNS